MSATAETLAPPPAPPPALQAQNLSWGVRGAAIVQNVSLAVPVGSTVGLIGPNGSGKSTLLRLLAGIYRPQAGTVQLHGRPLAQWPRRQVAQQLALVAQLADTQDAITVQDAVELGRTPWLSALQTWSAQDDAIVRQALAAVGLADKARRLWHSLSGGERQRVHIARALAQQSSVLLLDEPANHLDIHQQLALSALIARLPGTKLMALHELNQAQHCDWLAAMHGGRLVAFGRPDEVLTPELLANVFKVRLRVLTDPEDGSRVLRFIPLS